MYLTDGNISLMFEKKNVTFCLNIEAFLSTIVDFNIYSQW